MISRTISFGLCPAVAVMLPLSTCAQMGTTEIVSVSLTGGTGNRQSFQPTVNFDGRFVAFSSEANDLVSGDFNNEEDIFVRDRLLGQTSIVSLSNAGVQPNAHCHYPVINYDGRYVAYWSDATNLVVPATSGERHVFLSDRQKMQTILVSRSPTGVEGNALSERVSISGNGRYVAFFSSASNLVGGDTNGVGDVFVYDALTGLMSRVSVSSSGAQANGLSDLPGISGNGRYVAFHSDATNLVPGDTNGERDVFVHDRLTGATTRISMGVGGAQANGMSLSPTLSADGRYVAFESLASNLVPGDTNGQRDAFVHDRLTGQTRRISVSSAGTQGNSFSGDANISANGRFVAFWSNASNLVSGDTNGARDVFVHDLQTASTRIVSVASNGTIGNLASSLPRISGDGQFVAHNSLATNLAPGENNNGWDVFIHQYGYDYSSAMPSSFSLFRGIHVSGGLSELSNSDNMYFVARPGLVLSSAEAPVQLIVTGASASQTPDELRFICETHTSVTNIHQTISLFDFTLGAWVEMDSRPATTTDSVVEIQVGVNPSRFVQAGTGEIRARIAYRQTGPVISFPWFARIDQTIWQLAL